MEKEIFKKIFYIDDFRSKNNMEKHIEEYIKQLKTEYPNSIITKEFYKGSNIMVKVTQISQYNYNKTVNKEKQEELEKEEVKIKERGINGIGENVERKINNSIGGNERERRGR